MEAILRKPLGFEVKSIARYINAIANMFAFAWRTGPLVVIGLLTLQIVRGIFPIVNAWITKSIFDLLAIMLVPTASQGSYEVFTLIFFKGATEFISGALAPVDTFLRKELSRKSTIAAKVAICKELARLDGLKYFEVPEFYDTIQMASQGVHSGPAQIINITMNIASGLITLFSFLGVLFVVDRVLAFVVIAAALPQLLVQFKMGQKRFDLVLRNSPKQRLASYIGNILSSTSFVKEIRLFSLEGYFLKRLLGLLHDLDDTQRLQQVLEIRWELVLICAERLISGIAFGLIVYRAMEGDITLGDITLFLGALGSVRGALNKIVASLGNLNENILFFSRFSTLQSLPPALPPMPPLVPISDLQRGIEFRNVSFRYSEQHPWVLRNVNLIIPKGKCLALVGLNGSGKTTLVKLLSRLYDPVEGEILWDGENIRRFEIQEYRKKIGVIFQDFVHYDLTAQENIGFGNIDELENLVKIQASASLVGINEWLERLPRGYQTVLSRWLVEHDQENTELSVGQWQKIAIARMFMRDSKFMILDEPTAALDIESEFQIYEHFAKLTTESTSLLISHRFSTVRMADIIAVLQDGKIQEYGSHYDLMEQNGIYASLFRMQASRFEYAPHE